MYCNEDEEMDKEVCLHQTCAGCSGAVEDLSHPRKGSRPTGALCDLVSRASFFHSLLAPVKEAINYINTQHHASSILTLLVNISHPY